MPPICNVNAVITCPHQAGIVKVPPKQTKVMVGGAPALRISDVVGAPVMPGCPNLPTPATPAFKPCTSVVSPAVKGSTKVMIMGVPAMVGTDLMTTDSVVPVPNGTTVKYPGQIKVMANG